MKNWKSLSLKGCWVVSVLPLQYSPDRMRKKKATQVILLMVMFLAVVPLETVYKACIKPAGRGHTLVGGESSF